MQTNKQTRKFLIFLPGYWGGWPWSLVSPEVFSSNDKTDFFFGEQYYLYCYLYHLLVHSTNPVIVTVCLHEILVEQPVTEVRFLVEVSWGPLQSVQVVFWCSRIHVCPGLILLPSNPRSCFPLSITLTQKSSNFFNVFACYPLCLTRMEAVWGQKLCLVHGFAPNLLYQASNPMNIYGTTY